MTQADKSEESRERGRNGSWIDKEKTPRRAEGRRQKAGKEAMERGGQTRRILRTSNETRVEGRAVMSWSVRVVKCVCMKGKRTRKVCEYQWYEWQVLSPSDVFNKRITDNNSFRSSITYPLSLSIPSHHPFSLHSSIPAAKAGAVRKAAGARPATTAGTSSFMLVAALRPTVTAAGCTTLAAGMKALALCMVVIGEGRSKGIKRE